MSEIGVKCCPLLGCKYSLEHHVMIGNQPILFASLIPCVGEMCINFAWDYCPQCGSLMVKEGEEK